ncbi:zf-HC2 domain-containing protein [Streptomyces sp. NPDC006334]|uniref:zf-HC2 domain-containing protein n=1 Tax=Streptomyces sp. NPDC006334 TaxID=3156754 RepID=UPI0033BA07B5
MTKDDAIDLTGAYAMDALDPEEREAFRRHCAECPECARETVRHQEAAAWLALAASRPPPECLKVRVLAEAARTPQFPPLPPADDATPPAGGGSAGDGTSGGGTAGGGGGAVADDAGDCYVAREPVV